MMRASYASVWAIASCPAHHGCFRASATNSGGILTTFDMKYSAGTMPHEAMMSSIELYGGEVIPKVRELLATEAATTGA